MSPKTLPQPLTTKSLLNRTRWMAKLRTPVSISSLSLRSSINSHAANVKQFSIKKKLLLPTLSQTVFSVNQFQTCRRCFCVSLVAQAQGSEVSMTAWLVTLLWTGRRHSVNIWNRHCTNTEQSSDPSEMPKSTLLVYYLTLQPASPVLTPHLPRSLSLTPSAAPPPPHLLLCPPPPPARSTPQPLAKPGPRPPSTERPPSPQCPHPQRLPQVH